MKLPEIIIRWIVSGISFLGLISMFLWPHSLLFGLCLGVAFMYFIITAIYDFIHFLKKK